MIYETTSPWCARFEQAFSGRLLLVKDNPLQARSFTRVCRPIVIDIYTLGIAVTIT